ncbi:unnamed protein product [Didymodactylos carnosus]|uniref:Uncharacterized protein n=1 Tax=Didymodactylos carnosus TaxID=1234261 RepID=A0A8S2QU77_9BILA|nr:unnamed protein product [Didymodactylos carnosus]CAF4126527.1 unnamed protein product [Didymodactylos carnosus]
MTEVLNTLTCNIVKCLPDHVKVIENYNLPYHPFLTENYERQDDNATIIMNLYFFYIKDILNDKTMTCAFIHKLHEFKNYLFPLLRSDFLQNIDSHWATITLQLLETQTNFQKKSIQLYDQIQFTLPSNITENILFPKLQKFYTYFSVVFDECVTNRFEMNYWLPLINWINEQQNVEENRLNLNEIKSMLILKIYYDYYYQGENNLMLLHELLETLQMNMEFSPEEIQVFRVLLEPVENMIGYNDEKQNYLNEIFKIDSTAEDELSIRHSLVNLISMIILSGKETFLWIFTFQPLLLQDTYGFGSTTDTVIRMDGIHYDCGCILSETGDLMQYSNRVIRPNAMNIPSIYVTYFLTFGCLAWHVLLYENSVENLYCPVLSRNATDEIRYRIVGTNVRTHDACLILNRCFEQFAMLKLNTHDVQYQWIKPIFRTSEEELKAEENFQNQIFYPVY